MGILHSFEKKLHIDNPEQMKRELGWLWCHVKQYRRMIAAVGLLGLCGTAMSLASSVASKHLIDAVTGFGSVPIAGAAILMASMMLGGLVLQAVSSRVSATTHIRVRNEMQYSAYSRILRASWQSLEAHRSGDLLNRLNADIGAVSDGVIGFLPGLLTTGAKFVGAFCIMLYYDPIMALIALIGAPMTLLFSRAALRKLRSHNLAMKELAGEVMSFQEDSFRNLTSVKAFSVADQYEHSMARLQKDHAEAQLDYNSFQIGMNAFLSLVGMLVTAACFGWGIYQLWTGRITYGSMTMFLQLASTLRGAFSGLVSLAPQSISIATSAGRIMAVEALPRENAAMPDGFDREDSLEVSLQQVSFRYQSGDTVLFPFDFTARPGDLIAVTGPSGEGKTTLLRLLLGLVEPCEGTAEFVGSTGSHYALSPGTRGVFAYVPQGNSIFAGTVAENLRIIAPDATDAQMEQALKTACAWDFVSQFPDGLNHRLGAGGRGISEGQAQRLAIARALLRKAPILLLDEATSGLDEATERQLMDNLRASGLAQTCILVTHRPGSARFCNRAYHIHRGHVSRISQEESAHD